jgi:hypothetical protein
MLQHSYMTRFSTDFALHKLKTHARDLTTVSFYRSFATLLTVRALMGRALQVLA